MVESGKMVEKGGGVVELPTLHSVIYGHYKQTGETEFTVERRYQSKDDDTQITQLENQGTIEILNVWMNGWGIRLLKT